jgi:hypothetical protein
MAIVAGCELPSPEEVFTVGLGARQTAARLIPDGRRVIGFATGSGNSSLPKNWPLDRFIAVARERSGQGDTPVFLIGPSERAFADAIKSALPDAILAELDRPHSETGAQGIELALAIGEHLSPVSRMCLRWPVCLKWFCSVPLIRAAGRLKFARCELFEQDFGSEHIEAMPSNAVEYELQCLLDQLSG